MSEAAVIAQQGAEKLSRPEVSHLKKLESAIKKGMKSFMEVGAALLEVRDARLYRQRFGTFEEYCQKKWGITKTHANRLIDGASVTANLTPMGAKTLPENERQTRPLSDLPPAAQRAVWEATLENAEAAEEKITASLVQATRDEMFPPGSEIPEEFYADQEPVAVQGGKMAVHFSSESPEHYTPREVVDAVIRCMGGIDLDPCSNSHETPNVPALTRYVEADDGLTRPWHGRVYMNPPYGRGMLDWSRKLASEYQAGNVIEAIALVPARTDTAWWQALRDYPVCFVGGRLKFGSAENSAPFPSAAFYLGPNLGAFIREFSSFGDIWQRIQSEVRP